MAGETKIQGDVLILSAYDTSAYKPIACITSNDLSSSAEIIETKTKCDPGVVGKEYGAVNKSISVEGEYIDSTSAGGETTLASHDWLVVKQDAKTKVVVQIATGLADVPNRWGTVIISDLALTGAAGEVATFSATLEVDGALALVDPNGT
jgi:hypothetical protein